MAGQDLAGAVPSGVGVLTREVCPSSEPHMGKHHDEQDPQRAVPTTSRTVPH
ncbi:MAG: hypothetical protein F2518_02440 [Actinobacteria bacterium]|nr:hypothetical protein [Actinomycetota bacterium]